MPRSAILLFSIIFPAILTAQSLAEKSNAIVVKTSGSQVMKHAWAGGLNAPQFSEIDLNNDGIQDLFIFDREGWRVLTFINNGTSGQVDYTYAPDYEASFPFMQEFALLVDYNGDGKADIFTHDGGGGILVYKNTSSAGNLSFVKSVSPYLTAWYNSSVNTNLYCGRTDIPAITDIDNDGDIDILSFDNVSTTVNYFENFAADSGSLENFKYHLNTSCWGNFSEDILTNQVTLNKPCPKFKTKSGNKHSGSTILAFDNDADGDKDVLLGDVTYETVIFMENGGNRFVADMINQTNSFPASKSIELQVFPAAFLLDVNNDGKKDLIVAPNATNNIENQRGVWYFKNTSSTSAMQFTFVQDDFLQNEMLDFGTGAYPTLVDLNNDNLMDLVVGNNGIYMGADNPISKLVLYLNTGTSTTPEFTLTDESFGDIEKINLNTTLNIPTYNVSPSFGDVNADGFPDLFIGDYNGKIHFFINRPKNGLGDPEFEEADYLSIDVGQDASPQIFDVDRDGRPDLLIGNKEGKIAYYQNQGSLSKADFQLITKELGGVDTRPTLSYYGYSQPMFVKDEQGVSLLSGSDNGKIYFYDQVLSQVPSGSFILTDSAYLDMDAGERSYIASYDLDGDGFEEFIVGNSAGGLNYYESDYSVGIRDHRGATKIELSLLARPMGNGQYLLEISEEGDYLLRIHNASGQQIDQIQMNGSAVINTNQWAHGLYLISVDNGIKRAGIKLITGLK